MSARIASLLVGLLVPATAALGGTGEVPVPTVQGVSVQTAVQYDPAARNYTYTYTVTNPSTNTAGIWFITIDLTAPSRANLGNGAQFTIPRGTPESFANLQQRVTAHDPYPDGQQTVPFGITAPTGWVGSLTVNHTGGFAAMDNSVEILPGQTVSGLVLISQGLPTIRTMQLIPDWTFGVNPADSDPNDDVDAMNALGSIITNTSVLAPSWVTPGSQDHLAEMQADVNTATSLGWISNASLAQTLQSQMQTARNIVSSEGLDQNALTALQTAMTTLNSAPAGQINPSAFVLLSQNISAAIAQVLPFVPPPPPPVIPQAKITTPLNHYQVLPVGSTVTVVAQVINQAQNDIPLPNYRVALNVDSGPDAGTSVSGVTDSNGNVTLSYVGGAAGNDAQSLRLGGLVAAAAAKPGATPFSRVIAPNDTAIAILTGGPDLIINKFVPPVLMWNGKTAISISDGTKNIGTANVGPSTTTYYISPTRPVDPTVATVIGQRSVPALQPGQEDFNTMQVSLPATLSAGTYYLLACANTAQSVVETNYANNCELNELVAGVKIVAQPPACTASASNPSNFNGTSVPAGNYLWFNAIFKVNNIPKSGTTIDFNNGSVTFTAGGIPYNLAVPNAKVTFSTSASCTSTTFDSSTNTWMTTVPVTGDDEIFLTGLAWPVPSGGLPPGANPVNFNGTYSTETAAPGLSIQMQWSAAAYSSFTTDYNALQIKAGHQTACGQSNGDHAGTPEGVDNNNTAWKNYLVAGPRGGGGSNFTGSWSGTLNIQICP